MVDQMTYSVETANISRNSIRRFSTRSRDKVIKLYFKKWTTFPRNCNAIATSVTTLFSTELV